MELHKPVEILLVEDNPADVRLIREALKEARIANRLHVTPDGAEALAFLRSEGPYAGVPRPGVILLDLNLPGMHGCEVLREIKRDERLRRIPVVILSTSRDDSDVLRSYDLHANCYVAKPVDLDRFIDVIRSIEAFWLGVAELAPS